VEKKRQHIIPNCYLKSWCDPHAPIGQTYIWRISKDGQTKRKKSPEKSFRESDRYTVKLAEGGRGLAVEDALGSIESRFVKVLTTVRQLAPLSPEDRAVLCLFAAAMHSRSCSNGDHWKGQYENWYRHVLDAENAYRTRHTRSDELSELIVNAHGQTATWGIQIETPRLMKMNLTIIHCDDVFGFITSDDPCVWFNEDVLKSPKRLRIPALGQLNIEVTLPLTPHRLLFISHHDFPEYWHVGEDVVDQLNLRTRALCTKEFISLTGEVRQSWLD